jgi:two-component system, chemotaxis family, chemotaxis protein CheY
VNKRMLALVIDDSRTMRSIIRRIVVERGFDVVEAADGRAALDVLVASERVPDLALIDWNMPVMDGLEFVRQVRDRQEWRAITLVMVTTESEHAQVVRALAAGAHDYIIKPFTPDAIAEKLQWLGLGVVEVTA